MADKITKDKIIKSLLETSFYKSAGSTSLSDVAESLGIKKASLYNYFDNRNDMIEQAFVCCAEYLNSLSFIPTEIQNVTQKYPVATVFKGIVSRYVRMHEKSPLFQIWTFVQSQKYFDKKACEIVQSQNKKLQEQTQIVLESFYALKKIGIKQEQIIPVSKWFCSAFNDLLSLRLLDRKQRILQSPKSGVGELFTLESDDKGIERINELVEQFCRLLHN